MADFDKAYSFYLTGIGADQKCAPCYLGTGRVHRTAFRRKSARKAFERAYELDPRDPDVIVALAGAQASDDTRGLLLEEYLGAAGEKDAHMMEGVRSQLELWCKAPAAKTSTLVSPLKPYKIRLNIMRRRPTVSDGMYVLGSFNGGKPLKLQLDTGASGIHLNQRAADAVGLTALAPSNAFGLGDGGWQKTQIGLAERFSVGDAAWANVPVEFSERNLFDDSDGLLGTDVFSRFLIRMDIPEEFMELTPLPPYEDGGEDWREHDRVVPENTPSALLARRVGHSLLVPVLVNGKSVSYFLVDTGASMNMISEDYARRFTSVGITEMVRMKGVSGEVRKLYSATLIRMQFGHFAQEDHGMLALKLNDLNRANGVQMNGILGWPTLSQLVITLNYREGIVDFVHPSEARKRK